jgi:hypothetical protein
MMKKHRPEPKRPITVRFREDGEEWILDSDVEIAGSLEDFDSDDPSENAEVWDADRRLVRLRVKAQRIITLELLEPA